MSNTYSLTLSGKADEQIQKIAEALGLTPQQVIRAILFRFFDTEGYLEAFQIGGEVAEEVKHLQDRRALARIEADGIRVKRALFMPSRLRDHIKKYRDNGLKADQLPIACESFQREAELYSKDLAEEVHGIIAEETDRAVLYDRFRDLAEERHRDNGCRVPNTGLPFSYWSDDLKEDYNRQRERLEERYRK